MNHRARILAVLTAALTLAPVAPALAKQKPAPPDERTLATRLAAHIAESYDSSRGGWVSKDGMPLEGATDLAFALARARMPGPWEPRALATVDWTWSLFDSVGGGFYHRERDARPGHASFEKRTDSNARRLEHLLDAWQTAGEAPWRRRAAQVADYFDRVLLDGRGGFAAGQGGDLELEPEANGLAIRAWLRWAACEGRIQAKDFALKSLDRVREKCWTTPPGVMLRKGTFGEPLEMPRLADQVEMGRAYVLAAHLCGRAEDLEMARALGDRLIEVFEDREKGGFMTRASIDGKGKVRRAPCESGENARAALFLAELAGITGEAAYRAAARRSLAAFAEDLEKPRAESGDWAIAARAITVADLPPRVEWAAAKQAEDPPAPRSKSFRLRR